LFVKGETLLVITDISELGQALSHTEDKKYGGNDAYRYTRLALFELMECHPADGRPFG
jgi:hypothetical protein